jgi:hypothetical protein
MAAQYAKTNKQTAVAKTNKQQSLNQTIRIQILLSPISNGKFIATIAEVPGFEFICFY